MRIKVTAFSHIGRGSSRTNYDSLCTGRFFFREEKMIIPRGDDFILNGPTLCAVADGIGAHQTGELASGIAILNLKDAQDLATAEDVTDRIGKANKDVYDHMRANPACAGMGTTIAGIMIHPERLICFNVGDSRVYRFRDGFLSQISIDDRVPGSASRLTQALGGFSEFTPVEPHISEHKLPCPSIWLLCTDGLSDFLRVEQMEKCLTRSDDSDAVRTLYEAALTGGSRDDISIILVKLHEGKTALGATNFYR